MHVIKVLEAEDYSSVGNSRIGGKPDLPKSMEYPLTSKGFYEFIIQLNLSENKIEGLPNNGLLSIFYGDLDNREGIGFYFNNTETLEQKEIPTHLPFAGVTDFHPHNSHKIKLEYTDFKLPDIGLEYNNPNLELIDQLWETSYFVNEGLANKQELYFKKNGLELITNSIQINLSKNKVIYAGQNAYKKYNTLEDLINCKKTTHYENLRYPYQTSREEWISQLQDFERRKNYHIQRLKDFNCLLSLESLDKVGMIWGDYHKLEFYGYKNDWLNGNFYNLNVWMP